MYDGLERGRVSISLHDPLCVWYAMTIDKQEQEWQIQTGEDIRIETTGQWTRGMCVIDRRGRKMRDGEDAGEGPEVPGDAGGWLSKSRGNRLSRCIGTPGEEILASFMLSSIFG